METQNNINLLYFSLWICLLPASSDTPSFSYW